MKNVADSRKRHCLFPECLFYHNKGFHDTDKMVFRDRSQTQNRRVLLSPDANLISLWAAGCTLTQEVQKTVAAPTNGSTEKPRCSLQKDKWTFYCHTFVIRLPALAFIRNKSASSSQHWTVTKTRQFFCPVNIWVCLDLLARWTTKLSTVWLRWRSPVRDWDSCREAVRRHFRL